MTDAVLTSVDHRGIATITINRPEEHNAINDEVIYEIVTALDDLSENPNVKALWLNSFGKDFCSGTDLTWHEQISQASQRSNMDDAEQLARLLWSLYNFPVPTVVSVQGLANGSALGLICCCDIVLACNQSTFAIHDTRYGVTPAVITPYLIKAFGERKARYLCFSGKSISSNEAHELGLIDEVCERDHLHECTQDILARILVQDRQANIDTKSILHYTANELLDESTIDVTIGALVDSRNSKGFKQAIKKTLANKGVGNEFIL
jgi:methylglutaconyl-CoA hydratase